MVGTLSCGPWRGDLVVSAVFCRSSRAPPKKRRSAPVAHTRVGWESSFSFIDGFDPTGEYLGEAWGSTNLLTRTLVGYNHVAGAAGNKLVPDLA